MILNCKACNKPTEHEEVGTDTHFIILKGDKILVHEVIYQCVECGDLFKKITGSEDVES